MALSLVPATIVPSVRQIAIRTNQTAGYTVPVGKTFTGVIQQINANAMVNGVQMNEMTGLVPLTCAAGTTIGSASTSYYTTIIGIEQ